MGINERALTLILDEKISGSGIDGFDSHDFNSWPEALSGELFSRNDSSFGRDGGACSLRVTHGEEARASSVRFLVSGLP